VCKYAVVEATMVDLGVLGPDLVSEIGGTPAAGP